MQLESLTILERSALPIPQAKAILQAVELELNSRWSLTATREDLAVLRKDMAAEFAALRKEMAAEIEALRKELADLRDEVTALRGEVTALRGEVAAWRSEVTTLRGEVAALRGEMTALHGEVALGIEKAKHEVLRWVCALIFGQMAVLLGLVYFLETHGRP